MKILVYGLGKTLSECEEELFKMGRIIGYTDSYSQIDWYKRKPFIRYEKIKEAEFDCLIIALKNRNTAEKIRRGLVEEQGINEEKIVLYEELIDKQRHHYKLTTYPLEEIELLITGNSHAAYGLLEKAFSMPCMNLAVPSQDIRHSCFMVREAIDRYGKKFKQLKYILFDLYDYNYFNFDIKKSRYYSEYILMGGVTEAVCFQEQSKYKNRIKKPAELFEYDRYVAIEKNVQLTARLLTGTVVTEQFQDTIEKNRGYLEETLRTIRDYNPDIYIIFTLLPRYIAVEKVTAYTHQAWKAEFEEEILKLREKYGTKFWNFKECSVISGNPHFYSDAEHLNTIGAYAMTEMIDRKIKKL